MTEAQIGKCTLDVFTIGYEGRNLEDFFNRLVSVGITRVVDVRELPLSRRKGFSKTKLGEALEAKGIEYVHLRDAGNPYRAEKHDIERCLRLYRKHLAQHPEVVTLVADTIRGSRAALLCFEGNHEQCHRSAIAEALMTEIPTAVVKHL